MLFSAGTGLGKGDVRNAGCASLYARHSGFMMMTLAPSPHASGTRALCLLCINLCPNNAMQILFFGEYGQPHSPRWPELVVKNKGISLQ